jgi:hypothetical protein
LGATGTGLVAADAADDAGAVDVAGGVADAAVAVAGLSVADGGVWEALQDASAAATAITKQREVVVTFMGDSP